jgi:hypothetical protein
MIIFRSIFFLFVFVFYPAFSEYKSKNIKVIYSMHEAHDILSHADKHTLVLYDVDETLIMPTDKIHLPHFFSVDPGRALKNDFELKLAHCIEDIWSIVLLQAHRKLIEPDVVFIIKNLQSRNVKTLGFTKMRSGTFGAIDSLAEYRFNQLKALGVEFWLSYDQTIEFNQFTCDYDGFPMIHKGTIFTNDLPKGQVVGAFLDQLDDTITQVIFFDDLLENLISVENEMIKRNIIYHGYHYKAVDTFIQGELDCKVVQFQLDYLCTNKVWLSEQEASALINCR